MDYRECERTYLKKETSVMSRDPFFWREKYLEKLGEKKSKNKTELSHFYLFIFQDRISNCPIMAVKY